MSLRTLVAVICLSIMATSFARADDGWKKHIVVEGMRNTTAVAADYSGDGLIDVICNSVGKTRLFVAPDWKEIIIDETPGNGFIHSETMDVDGDGDLDFIGARYSPGLVVWLECPDEPLRGAWKARVADSELNGIHGLLKGDVDGDGRLDLIANSGQPVGPFANSAAWLRIPKNPRETEQWDRFIFADHDAPGLSHYMGIGDVNGDGRADISLAAKGGPQDESGLGEWFAWWEAPADPKQPFVKHMLPGKHPGATNIHPGDFNGDGKIDLLGSRGHGVGLVWFENPNWTTHEINDTLLSPHCLQVADLDNDGDLDAATVAYDSEIAAWFENDGAGNFQTHVIGEGQAAYDLRAVDMDKDGDLDLLVAGQNSQNVVWYENPVK